MNRRQLSVILVLVVLAYASDRLFHQQESRPVPETPGVQVPDAYARNVQMEIMGPDGKRRYQMHAVRMEYYPDTDRLEFQQPRVEMRQGPGNTWVLDADHGYTNQSGDIVWLLGNVIIQQVKNSSGKTLQITTRDVLVNTAERLAETDQAATVLGKAFRLEARGVSADFRHNRVLLRSRVRGTVDDAG